MSLLLGGSDAPEATQTKTPEVVEIYGRIHHKLQLAALLFRWIGTVDDRDQLIAGAFDEGDSLPAGLCPRG